VFNSLERIANAYGITAQKSMTEKRSSVNDALESAIIIIPFECPNGEGIMAGVKEAFVEDKDCGFQFGVYEPGQGTTFKTYTGNNTREFIMTRENLDQGFYYINVKNSDNPTLRDFCGVQWQAFGDKIKGKVFMITSLRPDLIIEEDSEDDDSPDLCPVEDVFDEADISNLGSNLGKMMSSLQKELNKQLKQMRDAQEQAAPDLAGNPNGKLERQLHAYKQLLEMQEEQIDKLQKDYKNNFHNPGARREINKRLRKLHKEAQKTTDKMEKLIKQMR
ncbi:MAG: hypothetical protein IK023_05995, partial [Bacteroidaceae bacterium]|nr:hypothetical protein [Bacteroidaceae bacterium]